MSGIIELIVAILVAIALGWLSVRAWRMRNLPLRILAGVVASLLTVLVAVISIVGLVGAYRLYAPHGGPAANIAAQATADQVAAAGRHATGCAGCHSSTGNLPLDGGNDNLLGGPIGSMLVIATMIVAIFSVHVKHGFWQANGGYELNALYIAASVAVAFEPLGSLSLDGVFGITALHQAVVIWVAVGLAVIGGFANLALRRPASSVAQTAG